MLKSVRTAAVLLAVSLLPAQLMAQDTGVSMDLGVKVGVNLATLSGDGESPGRRTGLIGGGHLTIGLPNSMFYFQPELLYSAKGFSESEGGNTATLALDYIDVPLLVGIRFDTGGSVTPRVFLGPQASIKASCKLKGSQDGDSASIDCDSELIGEVFAAKSVLFDILFGAGVDFDMGNVAIVFDARYDLGLTDALELGSSKMSALQFLAGVAFPLGN
ncbi:MAG: PorT family protein [Gemmatimonadetes bacterium]|nr:PorT family protein [Gemmatimonadota bacterium]MBT8478894.1 PorT family protein [Gemmatimonadota bacterium]NNK48580.1 PorT family protein [Gemmatimonadota bacterium]